MKVKVTMAALAILMFASCSKQMEMDNMIPDGFTPDNSEAIKRNVAEVFGVTFDPTHDWNSTSNGTITVNVNPNEVKKVQLMVNMEETNEDGELVTSMKVLNEADVNGASSVQLSYDAPSTNNGLYVAYINEGKTYNVQKVTGTTVNYSQAPRRAQRRVTLPTGETKISIVEPSYANLRGWIPGEMLYQMSDYTSQKIDVADYDDDYKNTFRTVIFSYFKNGRKYNNLPLVKQSGMYNQNAYAITTGSAPIILSPVYKNDGGYHEVENSDLYYYYFRDEDLGADPVAYLESLPKYKAIQFNQCIKGDDVIMKHASYALIYWGEGIPTDETVGSYTFPEGVKIGFMIRAKTTAEGGKKQGELYGDGRLNNYINFYDKCNFKSSNLGTDGPRTAWQTVNGKMMLCCESGTDSDFNDIIIEVEGGVDEIVVTPETEVNEYTFCFEDHDLGDYDMNDVVIKTYRQGNKVTYSIVACGAYDKLYIKNVNCGVITDDAEVHALFGQSQNTFINTSYTEGVICDPITASKTVASNFSFLDEANQPYIYNATTGKTIKLSKVGEDPHGIMIPYVFKHPLERVCIKDAYTEFNNWGMNPVISTTWYTKPTFEKIFR